MEKVVSGKSMVFIQATLFMVIFVIGSDTFLVSPLLPAISQEQGISVALAGLLVTAYSVSYAIFAVGFGPISDQVGRKTMLVTGMLSFAVFTALCGMAWDFWALFAFRALAGVAAAATSPQVWASVGDLIPFEQRGRAMGRITAALSVSQILGVPVAAFVAAFAGWRASFFAVGFVSLLVLGAVLLGLPKVESAMPGGLRSFSGVAHSLEQVLTDRRAVSGLTVTFFLMWASFGMYTYLGAWLSRAFDLEVGFIGTVIIAVGLGNLVGNLSGGYLADLLGKRGVLIGALSLMGVALFLLPYTAFSLGAALVCIFIWLVGGGASLASLNSILVELVPTLRGTMMSLNNSALYLGTTFGAAANGFVLGRGGFDAVGIASAAAALAAVILVASAVRVPETEPARQDDEPTTGAGTQR